MNKEKLRKLFGGEGDVSKGLAGLFGSAYLDHPDDTQDVSLEFNIPGFEVRDARSLIQRKIDETPRISCERNHELLTNHLEFMKSMGKRGREMDMEDGWQITIHSMNCPNSVCHELHLEVRVEGR